MPYNKFKVGEVRVVRPGGDPDELVDHLSSLYGNDIDFDMKSAYDDVSEPSDADLLELYGSNVAALSPMAQQFYARSMSSISKVFDPDEDDKKTYQEILQNTTDFLSQRHEMTDRAAAASVYAEAARANDSLTQDPTIGNGEVVIEHLQRAQKRADNIKSNPFGPEIMEAIGEKFPEATDEQIIQYAADSARANDLARMMSDLGLTDYGRALAISFFVPGQMAANIGNVVGDSIFDAWNAEDKLSKMITTYRSLPVERQMNLWKPLMKQIVDEMGPVRGGNVLRKFITPSGATKLEDFNNFQVALDGVDVVTAGASLLVGGATALTRLNKISRLSKMGSEYTASKHIADVLTDPTNTSAEVYGLEKLEASMDASPLRGGEAINTGVYAGASKETQARLLGITRETREKVDEIRNTSPIAEALPYSVVTRATDEIESYIPTEMYPSMQVTDVVTEKVDAATFKTTANVYDQSTGLTKKVKKEWTLTLDDNREYVPHLKTAKSTNVGSPKFNLRGNELATEDLNKALISETRTATLGNRLNNEFTRIYKLLEGNPITKRKKLNEVMRILEKGDEWSNEAEIEVGKIFDYIDLSQQYKLSDDQIEFYYGMRQFSDSLGLFHNEILRNRMLLEGDKDIKIPLLIEGQVGHTKAYGKVYDSPESARGFSQQQMRGQHDFYVLDSDSGESRLARDIDWEEEYGNGKSLVRLKSSVTDGADNMKHTAVIVDKQNISDLPQQVIKFKPGYFPRFYPRGVYATALIKKGAINGIPGEDVERKTLRLYDNEFEQRDDIANLTEKYREQGYDIGESGEWQIHTISPRDDISTTESAVAMGGRMYTSGRSSKPVPFGSDAARAERLDPIESIQRQIGNIAVHYPRHAQRVAMADRIEKLALAAEIDNFNMREPVTGTGEIYETLEYLRQRYLEWGSFRTQEETWTAARMRHMYENLVGKQHYSRDNPLVKGVWALQGATPVQAARTATFHLFLGMYNPVQLWRQAQGGLVAASVLPARRIPNVARGLPALTVAMNTKMSDNIAAAMGKAVGKGPEVGRLIIQKFKDTGYDMSVRANADIKQQQMDFANPISLFSKGIGPDTMFYSAGERFNRRLSWLVSLERYMNRNNLTDYTKLSDEDWHNINADSNTFMLSMHAANKARWQNGVMSIPTQFMQVQTKFIEEVLLNLENGLTPTERAKIALGQVAAYGAHGIPLVGGDTAQLLGNMLGMSDEEARTNDWLQNGLVGVMFHSMGLDVDVSAHSSVLGGVDRLIEDIMGGAAPMEIFLGAPGAALGRAAGSLLSGFREIRALAGEGEWDPAQYAEITLESIGGMASSYTNVEQALMIQNANGIKYDNYGNPLAELNPQTTLAVAMGFNSEAVGELWDLRSKEQAREDLRRKGTEILAEYWLKYFNAKDRNDKGDMKASSAMINSVLQTYFATDKARHEALSSIYENLTQPKTELQKELASHMQFLKEKMVDKLSNIADKAGQKDAD